MPLFLLVAMVVLWAPPIRAKMHEKWSRNVRKDGRGSDRISDISVTASDSASNAERRNITKGEIKKSGRKNTAYLHIPKKSCTFAEDFKKQHKP